MPGDASRQALRAEAVAFVHARRQKRMRVRAEAPQDAGEEGEGGDAVDVVIAVEDDALAAVDGLQDALDSRAHAGQEEGIGEVLEPRVEEEAGVGGIGHAAQGEEPCQEGRASQRVNERLLGVERGTQRPGYRWHGVRSGRGADILFRRRVSGWRGEVKSGERLVLKRFQLTGREQAEQVEVTNCDFKIGCATKGRSCAEVVANCDQ